MSQLAKLKWKLLPILIVTFLTIGVTSQGGKNILVFMGMTTYSHRMSIWPLIVNLADQGHNITFLSSHPPKSLADPRIHEYIPDSMVQFNRQFLPPDLLNIRLKGVQHAQAIWDAFPIFTVQLYEMLVQDLEFLKWVESAKFDLVFMDSLYCDFAMGLAYKFKAPLAVISTTSPYMWQNDQVGAPVESWIPDMQFAFGEDMTFAQRVVNVLKPVYWHLLRRWSYYPKLEKLLRENLDLKRMPDLHVLEKNVSLVLVNSHYSEEYARSLPPNVISIGGLHCGMYKNGGDLKELGKFMNESGKTGFIYVSFGSAAAVSKMPEKYKKIFFESMRQAKTNFVLKWEGDVPRDMPKNVFPSDWLPQQSVLDHSNIKGFITHGGLLGIQEAVCAGVPLIVLGMFAEQDYNANRIEKRGTGIKLDLGSLTKEKLGAAISNLLTDSSYKTRMEITQKLFLDRPQTPLETGTWWINYILRHGHVDSLQPLGIHQTFYERRALDVWSFVLGIVLTILLIVIKLILFVFRKCVGTSKKDKKKMN